VQKVKEVTATFGYAPSKNFELRIEGRYDKSDSSTFLKNSKGTPDDKQSGFLLEALYKI